jgi:CheY-like chemotaxis protein
MTPSLRTVLVVDDDAEIRETLMVLLEQEGYIAIGAANGVQALEQLRRAHPNVMLLDLMMPVMSGWEVLDELETTGELGKVPIIVVSAMCAPGARACLRKPVDLDQLLAVVAGCCHEPTASSASAPASPH